MLVFYKPTSLPITILMELTAQKGKRDRGKKLRRENATGEKRIISACLRLTTVVLLGIVALNTEQPH